MPDRTLPLYAARLGPGHTARLAAALALAAALTTLAALPGCNIVAAGAVIFARDKEVEVEAAYRGLAGQRVGVLVAADDATFFRFPQATRRVNEAVVIGLANALPDATLLTPAAAEDYVKRNPYWATRRPATLMRELGVTRLVTVDLNRYATHEAGNRSVFRGIISANVSVCEADGVDPDNRAFDREVLAQFPDAGTEFGVINGDEAQIEAAVLSAFSTEVANLFHDHVVIIPARR